MKKTRRSTQVGSTIQAEISAILQREVSDPEIGFVTITDVELSPDLRLARVFVSSFGSPEQQKRSVAALERNRSRVRHFLAQRASLRYTPELEFRLDSSIGRADKIEKILHKVLPKEETSNDDRGDDDIS